MTDSRHFLGFNNRTWWTLVIAVSVSLLVALVGSWALVRHFDAAQDRQQAQARRALEAKFSLALSISSRQSAYSINKSVCGFRGFVQPTLRSYEAASKDATLSASARARNDKRIRTTREFLDSQVTVPSDFDCRNLPTKPPTP